MSVYGPVLATDASGVEVDLVGELKVAFLGKGGSGKSTVAGTVCRQLGRRGHRVLALDVDTAPGLAYSLGAPSGVARLPPKLAELIHGDDGRYWEMAKGSRPSRLVDRYSVETADGIRFLELGKLPDRVEPSVSVAFRYVLERFRRPGWHVIADLAAGTRQPMFGWAAFAHIRVVVAEPSSKSTLTARRLIPMATHLVANNVRTRRELDLISDSVSLPVLGVIPYDENVVEADTLGVALIDFAPHSPAVAAAAALVARLEELT